MRRREIVVVVLYMVFMVALYIAASALDTSVGVYPTP